MSAATTGDDAAPANRRFAGIARLYGDAAFQSFRRAHVCVIGIGGVGTWVVEALARSAIGEMTLIDLDMIAESNTNRQIHALGDDFGRAKVEAMAARAMAINPELKIHQIEDFVTAENIGELLATPFDYVVDAIDDTRAKVAIAAYCRDRGLPLLTAGAAGGKIDPTQIVVDDLARTTQDALLSRMRQQLRKHYDFPRDPKRKFGIPAVFSREPMRRPAAGGEACGIDGRLSCTGYGSATAVTGSFGFAAASVVLGHLAARPQGGKN
ncbi:MAG TPA: tRNA threonylcarbamoyladenosine dehydratase [Rhodocyclaceae bacterium]|nr:tRNA threonylcarbamoyladenosine dehydratase [Rhodocyclaceae bacterium]